MSQNIPNNVGQTDSFKAKLLLYKYYRAHDIIYDIGMKDVEKTVDESDKLKKLTQQIEDRISKTIDSNSKILKKLRTPEEKPVKVPLCERSWKF